MRGRATPARAAAVVFGVAALTALTMARSQQPAQEQRPPVFRAGATFVNVDVYPRRDGRVLEGLGVADFEVLEDGPRCPRATMSSRWLPEWVTIGRRATSRFES